MAITKKDAPEKPKVQEQPEPLPEVDPEEEHKAKVDAVAETEGAEDTPSGYALAETKGIKDPVKRGEAYAKAKSEKRWA